jgi:hypothetical protein
MRASGEAPRDARRIARPRHSERPLMTSTIAARVKRTLHLSPAVHEDLVHFHIGANGQPFVCDLDRCESPGITPDDIGLSRG